MTIPVPPVLAPQQLSAALAQLPGWQLIDGAIEKTFTFKDFSAAFGFMTRTALLCESQNHHPEWSNVWHKVQMRLSTHEAGGVTERDICLAAAVQQLLQS